MADYTKMKNAELEALLIERGLPKTGKKADLVKRLEEDDAAKANAAPAKAANEDEIDWDDEPAAATDAAKAAAEATTEPAAAAVAAGGQGQPPNPQAVPNQVADIDPAKTDDLTVSAPAEDAPAAPAADASAAEVPAEEKKEPVDFSSGLAMTTLDKEIEKRKARAKKFGLDESTDEALKALERAKKFGGTDLPGRLNEALPEKRERKRGREGGEERGDNKKRGGRPGAGPRGGSNRRDAPKQGAPKQAAPKQNGSGGSWMTEADKAKAEARKAKFAASS